MQLSEFPHEEKTATAMRRRRRGLPVYMLNEVQKLFLVSRLFIFAIATLLAGCGRHPELRPYPTVKPVAIGPEQVRDAIYRAAKTLPDRCSEGMNPGLFDSAAREIASVRRASPATILGGYRLLDLMQGSKKPLEVEPETLFAAGTLLDMLTHEPLPQGKSARGAELAGIIFSPKGDSPPQGWPWKRTLDGSWRLEPFCIATLGALDLSLVRYHDLFKGKRLRKNL